VLQKEKATAGARLAAIRTTPALRLHPNLPVVYKKKVEKLAEALSEPGTAAEASEIIRALIDRIVLTPVDGILQRELYGDLAGIAQFAEAQKRKTKNASSAAEPALLSVVAGVGFEPTTFRL
jgi:site-specific DNA recombinase